MHSFFLPSLLRSVLAQPGVLPGLATQLLDMIALLAYCRSVSSRSAFRGRALLAVALGARKTQHFLEIALGGEGNDMSVLSA